jgi:hypothetical protein
MTTATRILGIAIVGSVILGTGLYGWLTTHNSGAIEGLAAVGAFVVGFGILYYFAIVTEVRDFTVTPEGLRIRFEGRLWKKSYLTPWNRVDARTWLSRKEVADAVPPVNRQFGLRLRDPRGPPTFVVSIELDPSAAEAVETYLPLRVVS